MTRPSSVNHDPFDVVVRSLRTIRGPFHSKQESRNQIPLSSFFSSLLSCQLVTFRQVCLEGLRANLGGRYQVIASLSPESVSASFNPFPLIPFSPVQISTLLVPRPYTPFTPLPQPHSLPLALDHSNRFTLSRFFSPPDSPIHLISPCQPSSHFLMSFSSTSSPAR